MLTPMTSTSNNKTSRLERMCRNSIGFRCFDRTILTVMRAFLSLMVLCLPILSCAQRNAETMGEIQTLTSVKLNLHDPLGALNNWDSSTQNAPCDWRGVACNANNRVTDLRLPQLQLGGRLSDRLGDLRFLRKLSLRSNFFNGTIPHSLAKCTLLHTISLQCNSFSGNLPPTFGNLSGLLILNVAQNDLSGEISAGLPSSLRYLDLSVNEFSGEIPSTIANLSQLQLLNLSCNRFTGEIPARFGQLQQIEYLCLDHNLLLGALPSVLANCSSLVHLSVEGNALAGAVPAAIGALSKLQMLSLSQNKFTGSVPVSFGNLWQLESLSLRGSGLNGTIPEELMGLSNLSTLDLSGNKFSGQIPVGIGNLSRLKFLNLSGNPFSGHIPSSIGHLFRLTTLDLSKQNLSGQLPFELYGLPNLQVVALQENKLSGAVPEGFSSLLSLLHVNLSSNSFSGHIPENFGFLRSLAVLSLSKNHISGVIPPEIGNCSSIEILELGSNSFIGNIPNDLPRWPHLKELDLGRNNLTGKIPEDISRCSSLSVLLLEGNHLSGSIPESLSELSNLTILDLSANKLSGEIPASISMLPSLKYFNVSSNNIEGEIPPALGSRFDNPSAFGNNSGLCGKPLDRKCEDAVAMDRKRLILLMVLVAIGALLLTSCCCFYIFSLLRWRGKIKQKASGEKKKSPARDSSGANRVRSSTDNGGPKLVMFNNRITLAETIEATRQFNEENVLGRTMHGLVFKAYYNDGMVLSIRRLPNGSLDENMLRKEAESLGRVKHRNLTVLRGYYAGPPDLRLLVYDYMPNGNLATLLQEASHQDGHVLNWPMRHLIALGIARGLAFLHQTTMVHGDVKPQNVLFDADFEVHLSDFGLERFIVATLAEAASTSSAVGTFGYVSPEAVLTGEVTKESDVYSFGIVLLELLTGKGPVLFTQDEDIVKWVKKQLQKDQITELLEPGLLDLDPESAEWEEFLLGVKVGLLCTAPDPLDRPTMSDIVFMLEGCRVGPDMAASADPTSHHSPA